MFEARSYDVSPLGDINGDGLDDLRLDDFVVFSEVDAGPVFADPAALGTHGFQIQSPLDGALEPSATGDINGDGLDDLLVSSASEAKSWVVFGKELVDDVDLVDVSAGLGGYELAGAMSNAARRPLGDVDGDGLGDLAVLTASAEVVVLTGKADGSPVSIANLSPLATIPFAAQVDAGDLDGDGVVDLAYAALLATTVEVGIIAAPAGWAAPPRELTPVSPTPYPDIHPDFQGHFEIRDFDGDGHMDLLITHVYLASISNWDGRLFPGPLPLGEGSLGESNAWSAGSPFTEAALLDAGEEPGVEAVLVHYSGVQLGGLTIFSPRLDLYAPDACPPHWDTFFTDWSHYLSPVGDVNGDGREDLVITGWNDDFSLVVTEICDP